MFMFLLYISALVKRKSEKLWHLSRFIDALTRTEKGWEKHCWIVNKIWEQWQCFYESFFYKVLCKKNSNFHLVKIQNHCSRHNICKTRLSAKLTTVTSSTTTNDAVSANVIIWVLQMGESGQNVSEKVKWA